MASAAPSSGSQSVVTKQQHRGCSHLGRSHLGSLLEMYGLGPVSRLTNSGSSNRCFNWATQMLGEILRELVRTQCVGVVPRNLHF